MTDGGFGGGEGLQPDLCDLCGTVIADRTEYCAFVRDSSAIYRHDPAMDGRRMVVACSPGHLDQLVEKCGRRPFVEAELRAGKTARAMFRQSGKAGEDELGAEAGLDPEQIRQAVAWRNREVERRRQPGRECNTINPLALLASGRHGPPAALMPGSPVLRSSRFRYPTSRRSAPPDESRWGGAQRHSPMRSGGRLRAGRASGFAGGCLSRGSRRAGRGRRRGGCRRGGCRRGGCRRGGGRRGGGRRGGGRRGGGGGPRRRRR
jgi:hypothetical protein